MTPSLRLPCLASLAFFLWNAAPLAAEELDLKSVVDEVLEIVQLRQAKNGSYGNFEDTCKVILALSTSHRRYGTSDGPFVRGAVDWVASQVGADGAPAGLTGREACHAACIAEAAFASLASRDPSVEQALARLKGFVGRNSGDGHEQDPVAPAGEDPVGVLSRQVQSLSERKSSLANLPPLLVEVARAHPEATLKSDANAMPTHWSSVVASATLTAAGYPLQHTHAPTALLADLVRVLSLCIEHPAKSSEQAAAQKKISGTGREPKGELLEDYQSAADASLRFLESQQTHGRFAFMSREDPGITAMALDAAIRTARLLKRPIPAWVDEGLDWLVSLQDKDGSIHIGSLKVYITSASILALTDARREKDEAVIAKGAEYLRVVQSDEGEGYDSEHDWAYGGIGYGGDLRPDLSNTQFGLEALAAAKVPSSDAALARALMFLQRCQNDPEINRGTVTRGDGKVVESGRDGGAVYSPGDSKAGLDPLPNGHFVARSYGSMTYALLKSYVFCGLPAEDPRMQAALEWIRNHYTLEYNPGFDRERNPGSEYQGLYYYYFTMAKALDVSGQESIRTADGRQHYWREELARHLLRIGFNEGFWSNQRSSRWWEETPVLATSYSLIALAHCLEPGSN